MQDNTTEVMSLDELMDLAAEAPTTKIARPQPVLPPALQPTTPPMQARPQPKPARTEPGQAALLAARMRADGQRMLLDARRAGQTGMTQARQWLETADNGLIVATILITLLLLVIVATL